VPPVIVAALTVDEAVPLTDSWGRLPYQYCSKNVSGYIDATPDLLLLIQQKLRIVQYRYGSLSTRVWSKWQKVKTATNQNGYRSKVNI